jgi:hypothetical protein
MHRSTHEEEYAEGIAVEQTISRQGSTLIRRPAIAVNRRTALLTRAAAVQYQCAPAFSSDERRYQVPALEQT